jgi:hypothetical protein
MKVLIVDECMAPGGVETLRLNLVPELARLCESIVWALPLPYGEALRERIQQRNIPNLVIENLRWPRGSIQQIQVAALRRVPRVPLFAGYADRLIRKSVDFENPQTRREARFGLLFDDIRLRAAAACFRLAAGGIRVRRQPNTTGVDP